MQLCDKETLVYIDDFFTSIPLLQELKESSINVVGTIGTNCKEYPKALQNKNLLKQMNRDDFHTVACKTTVCTVWKDTKHVSFLSNVHSSHGNCTISRKLRRGENAILPCPPCAVAYNKNMGAVDRHDQLVRNYTIDRKLRRWWVRMFVNFLDAIMVNAYIIYKENFKIMNMPAPENPQSQLNMTNLCLESSKSRLEIFLATVSLAHHQHCLPLLFMEESMILSISLSWRFSSLEDTTIVALV